MTEKTTQTQDPNSNAINSLNQITLAIAQLAKVTNSVFPTALATSLTATSGSITPKNYVGFLTVANPIGGGTIKIPYLND